MVFLHHYSDFGDAEVYFLTGLEDVNTSNVDSLAHMIHKLLNKAELEIVLPAYALTGCDTVNAFFWSWQNKSFQIDERACTFMLFSQ